MDSQQNSCIKTEEYLECEKRRVFVLMILVGGYLGAFTYSIRGGVFCNAQTGNFVLLAMALCTGGSRTSPTRGITARRTGTSCGRRWPPWMRSTWPQGR